MMADWGIVDWLMAETCVPIEAWYSTPFMGDLPFFLIADDLPLIVDCRSQWDSTPSTGGLTLKGGKTIEELGLVTVVLWNCACAK